MNNPNEVPLIFEEPPGRRGYEYPDCDVPHKSDQPHSLRFLRKKAADLPS